MSEPEVWRYLANESDYADLDTAGAVEHLSTILSFPTVSHMDDSLTDYPAFEAQQAYMRQKYPHVFSEGTVERVGYSLLITIPGTDASLKPVMFMGHQDVVSIVPGTENDWEHDPFSGYTDDTYIWGRGAIDMKEILTAKLEAVEYVLARGQKLRRTLMFAMGEDEESNQYGSRKLAALLAERGVELEFLVDEGDCTVLDGADYSAPGVRLLKADLAEKGYSDVRLTARSKGGHSSNPYGGTSLEVLSRAITRICDIEWPVRLSPTIKAFLGTLAPYITAGPLAQLGIKTAEDVEAHAEEIARACLDDSRLFPLVTTTCAPDCIEGGAATFNVMPQDMEAVINFRMLKGVSIADTLEACKKAVADLPVEVSLASDGSEPCEGEGADSEAMRFIREAAARYFVSDSEKLLVVNGMQTGASDSAKFADVCPVTIRFSGILVDTEDDEVGVHGTNERVTKRSYVQGIRFYIKLLELACL